MTTSAQLTNEASAKGRVRTTGLLGTLSDTSLSAAGVGDGLNDAAKYARIAAMLTQNKDIADASKGLALAGGALSDPMGTAARVAIDQAGIPGPVGSAIMGGVNAYKAGTDPVAGAAVAGAPSAVRAALFAASPPLGLLGLAAEAFGLPNPATYVKEAVQDTFLGKDVSPESGLLDSKRIGTAINESPDKIGTLGASLGLTGTDDGGWTQATTAAFGTPGWSAGVNAFSDAKRLREGDIGVPDDDSEAPDDAPDESTEDPDESPDTPDESDDSGWSASNRGGGYSGSFGGVNNSAGGRDGGDTSDGNGTHSA